MNFDPYATLGVARDATAAEVKRAYKRAAKALHPDVAGDAPETRAQFEHAVTAYQLLSDPEKRKAFDETGVIPDDQMSERNQLLSAMASIFNQIVDDILEKGRPLRQSDIVGAMRRLAARKMAELDDAASVIRRQVDELQDLRSRITRIDEAENIFASHLTHRIGGLTSNLAAVRSARRIAEMMQTELESYANEVELVRAMQFSFYSSGSSTFTSPPWGGANAV